VNNNSILFFVPASHFNEAEFLTSRDYAEKAGFKVFITSDARGLCVGQNGLKVKADVNLNNVNANNFAAFVLIGGAGAREYGGNRTLHKIAAGFNAKEKTIAAICSAPVILAKAGILNGITATCFVEDKADLLSGGADYKDTPLVIRKNIITANNPAVSSQFAEAVLNAVKTKTD
jgi:protease I